MNTKRLERRRSYRIPISGTASLQHAGQIDGLYTLENLSIGGCSLRIDGTEAGSARARRLGDLVDVALHVDDQGTIALPARVVRSVVPGSPRMGLSFLMTPPVLEDRLQDLVMRAIEREQHGEILLVDEHPERLSRLLVSLRGVGQRIIAARTARDAMHALEHTTQQIRLVFVSPIVGTSQARDIVKTILRRAPHVQCVLLGRGSVDRLVQAIRGEVVRVASPWSWTRLQDVITTHEVVVKAQSS